MAKSIERMSLEELQAHQKEVDAAIKAFAKKQRSEAIREMREVGKKYGVTPEELFGGASAAKTTAKGAPKYANPDNPDQTWTGRGRQPQWLKDALKSGKSMDDLAI